MTSEEYEQVMEETKERIVTRIELLPSFNQKSAFDMGARAMKEAVIREIQNLRA